MLNFSDTFSLCSRQLQSIFTKAQVDHTHGIQHALLIVQHGRDTLKAALDNVDEEEQENILLACLLHDADDKKYFPFNKNYDNARLILKKQGVSEERIEKIIGMICVVSFSKNGDKMDNEKGEEWYYPRYSDRIDAIGYKGIVRAYEYAKHVKNPISLPNTKVPQNQQNLAAICEGREEEYIKRGGTSQSFIDHIYDKLIHLKLPQRIRNPFLIAKYEQGRQAIIDFVMKHAATSFNDVEKELQGYLENQTQ